ncbi:MAG TPA: Kdo hydroxylase family protein [Steroidobacteraceae bacterium]|nr:Kdo hydroxylase family protein [Steroidobacteraceae bacterium]
MSCAFHAADPFRRASRAYLGRCRAALDITPEPIDMTDIVALPITDCDQARSAAVQQQAIDALESGTVLFFPQLGFPVEDGEDRLLSATAIGQAKNISLDPATGVLRGSSAEADDSELLRKMMMRFARFSSALVRNLMPRYDAGLQQARASYRPVEIAGRSTSWRKDDTRLHVDSFPSSPTQGRRILRVFANINPHGGARTWRLGEPFEDVAQRYVPSLPAPIRGASLALNLLGITKSRRSDYDHYMLRLHDRMKADLVYQSQAVQRLCEFPAGSTWVVFTDQVSHAAMSGQYALEQTFHLPVHSMLDPSRSPLRILERLLGRRLV